MTSETSICIGLENPRMETAIPRETIESEAMGFISCPMALLPSQVKLIP